MMSSLANLSVVGVEPAAAGQAVSGPLAAYRSKDGAPATRPAAAPAPRLFGQRAMLLADMTWGLVLWPNVRRWRPRRATSSPPGIVPTCGSEVAVNFAIVFNDSRPPLGSANGRSPRRTPRS